MPTDGTLIRGWVHRVDGGAVVEARVYFESAPIAVPDVALLTDERGRFTLYAPVPGRYRVACRAEDAASASVELDLVETDAEVEVEIELDEMGEP